MRRPSQYNEREKKRRSWSMQRESAPHISPQRLHCVTMLGHGMLNPLQQLVSRSTNTDWVGWAGMLTEEGRRIDLRPHSVSQLLSEKSFAVAYVHTRRIKHKFAFTTRFRLKRELIQTRMSATRNVSANRLTHSLSGQY